MVQRFTFLEINRSEPSLDLVLELAELFSVSTDYLLRDTIPIELPHQPDAPQAK